MEAGLFRSYVGAKLASVKDVFNEKDQSLRDRFAQGSRKEDGGPLMIALHAKLFSGIQDATSAPPTHHVECLYNCSIGYIQLRPAALYLIDAHIYPIAVSR